MASCINCGKELTSFNETYPLWDGTSDRMCNKCKDKYERIKKKTDFGSCNSGGDMIVRYSNELKSFGFTESGIVYIGKYVDSIKGTDTVEKGMEIKKISDDVAYAQMKEKEAQDIEKFRKNTQEKFKPTIRGAVFHVDGSRGRCLDVFPNKCIISVNNTLGAFVTGNATDGEKTIYFGDCIGLQYKRAGVLLGYLQLETASPIMNNNQNNFFNENTFTYEQNKITNYEMDVIVDYVKAQVEKVKVRMYGDGRD